MNKKFLMSLFFYCNVVYASEQKLSTLSYQQVIIDDEKDAGVVNFIAPQALNVLQAAINSSLDFIAIKPENFQMYHRRTKRMNEAAQRREHALKKSEEIKQQEHDRQVELKIEKRRLERQLYFTKYPLADIDFWMSRAMLDRIDFIQESLGKFDDASCEQITVLETILQADHDLQRQNKKIQTMIDRGELKNKDIFNSVNYMNVLYARRDKIYKQVEKYELLTSCTAWPLVAEIHTIKNFSGSCWNKNNPDNRK